MIKQTTANDCIGRRNILLKTLDNVNSHLAQNCQLAFDNGK